MAQLFTVYFPKYYFDLQKEFAADFKADLDLPFEYIIEDGCCYVSEVFYDKHNNGDPYYWQNKGLQIGLRIISINNTSLLEYHNDDDDGNFLDHNPDKVLTKEEIETIIGLADTQEIFTIEFREEVNPEDHSIPLGLQYSTQDMLAEVEEKEEVSLKPEGNAAVHHPQMSDRVSSNSMRSNNGTQRMSSQKALRIENKQIGASSFEKGYEPVHCRLNHPTRFWCPSDDDQTTLDTWLRIDLGMRRMVTKLHLQGSPDRKYRVDSFWIDYSDDCCQWKSHAQGEIKCNYMDHSRKTKKTSIGHGKLPAISESSSEDLNYFYYAEVMIWPTITARFIRIRPYTINNANGKVAVRMELFGYKELQRSANEYARVVTLKDVNERDKGALMERTKNLPANTKVIQVDCKAVIQAALDKAKITSVGFLKADQDNFICVFTTGDALESEEALNHLAEIGVGRDMGVISTTNIAFRNESQKKAAAAIIRNTKKKESSFYDSVKSRMIVKQVVERIMNSSLFTFDYVCMLVVASLIAVGGLATDNSVIVVASMLVSPLMGPVLAFTFGVTLQERNMAIMGLRNEVLSLLVCVITGFITGFLYCLLSSNYNEWPTGQMTSRGTVEGLADGAFIAAASGVGVALSVLGDYLSTVVGVAISASLLPPAVNCGMLYAFPLYAMMFEHNVTSNFHTNHELIVMGTWSLVLTIENIILIFVVSRFMFWIKNVYVTKDNNEKVWKSVTNFRRRANPSLNRTADRRRENIMYSLRGGGGGNGDTAGSITDKIRQSIRFRSEADFEGHSGTLKGGVLKNLSRQRSAMYLEQDADNGLGLKSRVKMGTTSPSSGSSHSSKGVLPMKPTLSSSGRGSVPVDDSDHSTGSDDESQTHSEDQNRTKRVAVNDLFSQDQVEKMTTPVNGDDSRVPEFPKENGVSESAVNVVEMTTKDADPKESSTIPLIDEDKT